MFTLDKFLLTDVHRFRGEHSFNLRPLTFLTGEDGTGKSTVLGCLQAAGEYLDENMADQYMGINMPISFNNEPYEMGSFSSIARRARPKNTEFKLGFEFRSDDAQEKIQSFQVQLILRRASRGSDAAVKEIHFIFDDGEIKFLFKKEKEMKDTKGYKIAVEKEKAKKIFTVAMREMARPSAFFSEVQRQLESLMDKAMSGEDEAGDKNSAAAKKELFRFINKKKFLECSLFSSFGYFSFASLHSEPEWTVNPLVGAEASSDPIPITIGDLSVSDNEKNWQELKRKFIHFGNLSGLFTGIQMRHLDESHLAYLPKMEFDFDAKGTQAISLTDMAYGMGQLLPVLVCIFTMDSRSFLVQHPEIHLHPKAQSALVALLVELHKQKNDSFVIETHSESLINSARIEIAKGSISHEDVSFIHIEEKGKEVIVHNIESDRDGNLVDPPNSQGQFFLKESYRILGVGDDRRFVWW